MPELLKDAAKAVVQNLGPFEAAVDIALAQGGRFLATLSESRLDAELAPGDTHSAVMSAIATVSALGTARDGMVTTRRELARTRAKLGLRTVGIGGLMGCPDDPEGPSGSLVENRVSHEA